MGIISVDLLKPETVLTGDVKDRSGRVLLRAGMKLTEHHLKTLRARGVTEVDVEGESAGPDGVAEDPEAFALAETELKEAFRHTDQKHPAMRELFRLSVLYWLKQKRKG